MLKAKEVSQMIDVEVTLTVEQCQELGIPTAVREHRIVVFIATTPEVLAEIKIENQYLQDEIIIYTPPFVPAVATILGLQTEGVIIVDRNLKIRQADQNVTRHKVSQNLMQLISACGCDLSDQY